MTINNLGGAMDREQIKKEWESGSLVAPEVDIYEQDDAFIIVLNMPGVSKEGAEVKFADGLLTVYGAVKNQEISDKCILDEIEHGNFYREFKVGDTVDVNQISAKMEDGVLSVTLPKHERIKPRQIPVEVI